MKNLAKLAELAVAEAIYTAAHRSPASSKAIQDISWSELVDMAQKGSAGCSEVVMLALEEARAAIGAYQRIQNQAVIQDRHEDEIDAARQLHDWMDEVRSRRCAHRPSSRLEYSMQSGDTSTVALWVGCQPIAMGTLMRDDFNHTVLTLVEVASELNSDS